MNDSDSPCEQNLHFLDLLLLNTDCINIVLRTLAIVKRVEATVALTSGAVVSSVVVVTVEVRGVVALTSGAVVSSVVVVTVEVIGVLVMGGVKRGDAMMMMLWCLVPPKEKRW